MIERRRDIRESLAQDASVFFAPSGKVLRCAALNFSELGAKIALDRLYALPQSFLLSFDDMRTARNCRLVWLRGNFVGIEFQDPTPP